MILSLLLNLLFDFTFNCLPVILPIFISFTSCLFFHVFLFACLLCSFPSGFLVVSAFIFLPLSIIHFSPLSPIPFVLLLLPPRSLPLAANPERGRSFCRGWGQADTMWPCRAASPYRAGPQPGVTDGFLLLFSSAVKHRRTWWNQPAAIQRGESTFTKSRCFLLAGWLKSEFLKSHTHSGFHG